MYDKAHYNKKKKKTKKVNWKKSIAHDENKNLSQKFYSKIETCTLIPENPELARMLCLYPVMFLHKGLC